MCFSALSSFSLGSLLIPIGAYSAVSAYKKNRNFLLLAFIPIMFGIQQVLEGMVWVHLQSDHIAMAYAFAYAYLFFAFAFWPAYVPFCAYLIEEDVTVQKILKFFMVAGPVLAAAFYGPIILGFISFKVGIVDHIIFYDVYQSDTLMWAYTICYGIIVIFPLLISSVLKVKIYGLIALTSLLIAYWFYFYQFTSVWCFFSAILSFYIIYIIYKLRVKKQ